MLDLPRRAEAWRGPSLEASQFLRTISQVIAVAVPAVLYLRTMPPTFYNIDSAELTTAARTVGIPHPPGYPLYVLLGHTFTWLPVGDYGYRVNLMSAVLAAVALYCVYRISMRLTREPLPALAATWVLGFSYPFWSNAIVAEVYTLDAALVAATLLFLLRWRDEGGSGDLMIAAVIFGLSLTNRTTNILALPAIALFLWPAWREQRQAISAAALAAIPPLALYALLPLRSMQDAGYRWGATYNLRAEAQHMDLARPHELWWYVSSRVFRDLIRIYDFDHRVVEVGYFARDLWGALLGGGVVVAAVGFTWLFRRDSRAFWLLALVAIPQAVFYINYAAPDKQTMFLTVYLIVAIGIGCGIARIMEWLRGDLAIRRAPQFVGGGVAIAALLLVISNYGLLDLSQDDRARRDAEGLFATANEEAVIVGDWTDVAPLEYLQIVEHQREDVSLVHQWALPGEDLRDVIDYNLAAGRDVYAFDEDDPVLREYYGFTPVEDWFRLSRVTSVSEAQ